MFTIEKSIIPFIVLGMLGLISVSYLIGTAQIIGTPIPVPVDRLIPVDRPIYIEKRVPFPIEVEDSEIKKLLKEEIAKTISVVLSNIRNNQDASENTKTILALEKLDFFSGNDERNQIPNKKLEIKIEEFENSFNQIFKEIELKQEFYQESLERMASEFNDKIDRSYDIMLWIFGWFAAVIVAILGVAAVQMFSRRKFTSGT